MALAAYDTDPTVANSYVTQAAATTYFTDAIHAAAWTAAATGTKDAGLVTATRMLDRLTWAGTVTTSSNPLQWPRTGVVDRDGTAISSSVVPTEIREATYELALALIAGKADQYGQAGTVSSLQSRDVAVTFAGSAQTRGGARMGLPEVVYQMIAPLLASAQMGAGGRGSVYGTTDDDGDEIESQFKDIDAYDPVEPL